MNCIIFPKNTYLVHSNIITEYNFFHYKLLILNRAYNNIITYILKKKKNTHTHSTFFFCLPPPDLAGLEDGGAAFSFFGACNSHYNITLSIYIHVYIHIYWWNFLIFKKLTIVFQWSGCGMSEGVGNNLCNKKETLIRVFNSTIYKLFYNWAYSRYSVSYGLIMGLLHFWFFVWLTILASLPFILFHSFTYHIF